MPKPTEHPPTIIELPNGCPVRWVGSWNRDPKKLARQLRRKGWLVQIIGNVVRIVCRPSVKGW
jgi:hypothetical protein